MSSELKINKPGFVDFLLAGFAGGATGVQKGLQTRQAAQATKAQQDILNQFRERAQTLAEKDAEALKRHREAQRELTRREGKAGRDLQSLLGMTFEERKELTELEAELKKGKPSFLEKMLGFDIDPKEILDMANTFSLITNRQDEVRSRQLRDQIANIGGQFEREKFAYTKLKDETARWDTFALKNFDVQNQRAIKQYDTLVDVFMTTEVVPVKRMHAEQQMSDLRYYLFRSLFDPNASSKEKREAGKGYEWLSKRFERWMKDELNIEHELPKIDWEDAWYKRAKPIPGETAPAAGAPATRQPLPFFGGPTGITPSPGGGGEIQQAIPPPANPLDFIGQPAPQLLGDQDADLIQTLLGQRQAEKASAQDISDAVAAAKRGKKTSLTDGDKEGLRAVGFSEADIAKVERELGKK